MTQLKNETIQIYLENIIKNVPGAIYWKDVDGVYLGCNLYEAQIAGLQTPEEMIGKTDYDLSWKNVADTLRATDTRIMKTQKSEELIESALLENGIYMQMLTNKAPLYDNNGKVIGIIGTSIDITERIEVQKREQEALLLAASASEMNRRIEEETKRALMVLAGSMSHDLRTPLLTLRAINLGLAQIPHKILKNNEDSVNLQHYYKIMDAEIQKIRDFTESIINKMNDFINSNLKAIKYSNSNTLKHEDLVVCKSYKVIKEALEAYPFHDQEHDLIETDTTYYFDFLGNPVLILRIFFNLIKNALEQIHEQQTGTIFISCWEEEKFNIISVKDTAGGASPDIVQHIFDGYKTTKKTGTGIGLAFCKLTMESFGGSIVCKSVEGEYMKFILKFPKLDSNGYSNFLQK